MERNAQQKLIEWLENGQTDLALNFVRNIKATGSKRTDAQHRAWFLWLGMIEKEAENAGITFDNVIQHTHQLRITRENLHEIGKQLQKALWGTTSTKDLEKIGQIEILVQHFVDLFSKVGLELPPFPEREKESLISNIETAKAMSYPNTYTGAPTI